MGAARERLLKATGPNPPWGSWPSCWGKRPEQVALAIQASQPALSLTPVSEEDGGGAGYPGGIARGGTGRPHQPAGGAGDYRPRTGPLIFCAFSRQDPERNSQGAGDHPGEIPRRERKILKHMRGDAADGINFGENAKIQIVMPVCTAGTAHYSLASAPDDGLNFHKGCAQMGKLPKDRTLGRKRAKTC